MNNNQLLVIAHSYSNFVKGPTDELAKNYREVTVLVRMNPFAEIYRFLRLSRLKPYTRQTRIDYYRQPTNLQVFTTPIWYFPTNVEYKKLGVKHFEKVEKYIQSSKTSYNLVHSHFTWSAGYVGARLKEKYTIPFVVTAHGFDIYALPFESEEWKEKIEYVLNTADGIITVSHSNLQCIQKLNVTTPVTVIPNGFRSDIFYPKDARACRKALNLPIHKKILLTVGNLESVKGHKYLIDAVRIITEKRNDILCLVIGDGEQRASLERQVFSLGMKEYFMFQGRKPQEEIPDWINASDIFVLPSLNEGNPTVMFETLGCGIPFVGTTVGGVPEIITKKEYGLLSKPGDPVDLAKKIEEALQVQWDRARIVNYAQHFTWNSIAKEVLEVHRKVQTYY